VLAKLALQLQGSQQEALYLPALAKLQEPRFLWGLAALDMQVLQAGVELPSEQVDPLHCHPNDWVVGQSESRHQCLSHTVTVQGEIPHQGLAILQAALHVHLLHASQRTALMAAALVVVGRHPLALEAMHQVVHRHPANPWVEDLASLLVPLQALQALLHLANLLEVAPKQHHLSSGVSGVVCCGCDCRHPSSRDGGDGAFPSPPRAQAPGQAAGP